VQKLEVELGVLCRRSAVEAERSRGEAVVQEEDEAGRCQGGLFAIPKKFRDLSVNQNFSLLQRSNEKTLNMKVVENFKSYNNALGFKFKIS
jgi:hypothetical protein